MYIVVGTVARSAIDLWKFSGLVSQDMVSGCSAESVRSHIRVMATELFQFTSAVQLSLGQEAHVNVKSPCGNTRSRAYNVPYRDGKKGYDWFSHPYAHHSTPETAKESRTILHTRYT